MTKSQIKAHIKKLSEALGNLNAMLFDLADEISDLQNEVEETSAFIAPYGDRYELTEQQEERQEWLDELASDLESMASDIHDHADEISYIVSNLEDKLY